MRRTILIMLLSICCLSLYGEETASGQQFDLSQHNNFTHLVGWKTTVGDNDRWSQPEFDDSDWETLAGAAEYQSDIRWYRKTVVLNGSQDDYDILAFYFNSIPSAFEVYWDGELLAKNGVVGNDTENETPGDYRKMIKLKRELTTPGEHLVAVRLSNHHTSIASGFVAIPFGYYNTIQTALNEMVYFPVFNFGIFLLAFLFSFALFLGGGQQRPYLIFSLYCFLCMIGMAFSVYPIFQDADVTYLIPQRMITYLLVPATGILLGGFFVLNFQLENKYLHIGIITALAILPMIFFGFQDQLFELIYLAGVAGYAIYQKKVGSISTLIGILGLLAMLIIFYWGFQWYVYTAGITFFLVCVVFATSRQLKKEHQLHEASRLRSARLEAELLKKNIQPHFLMNTLLSIMSWIKQDPGKAIKLIKALGEEFRMINKISSEREISLHDEIALCRTHLELMGCRKDVHYELHEENIPDDAKIPPMVIHTLIENGLTHAYQTGENGEFTLSCEKDNGALHYRLKNDGSRLLKQQGNGNVSVIEGMGLKYVKARLEERYPNKWQLDYGLEEGNWEVNIIIDKN